MILYGGKMFPEEKHSESALSKPAQPQIDADKRR
jgi:hypothetical protein